MEDSSDGLVTNKFSFAIFYEEPDAKRLSRHPKVPRVIC